jgi:anti-sigma B factor antagonist/stage II sporulation protein AA (anti-sigma F factor antagonist)
MEGFEKTIIEDVAVETVNLARATYEEAGMLKKILNDDIEKGFKKIIIDLAQCDFIDSTFIGVLVVTLKKIAEIGGELRLIKPASFTNTILATSGTLTYFNIADTIEEGLKSF